MKEKRKILLTGATGHVGYAVLKDLVDAGEDVTIFIRKESRMFKGIKCCKILGDITDYETLENALDGIDVVIHSAGKIDIMNTDYDSCYKINYLGTENVVKACLKKNVKRLIYFSSCDVYKALPGNELMDENTEFNATLLDGDYAKTKALATNLVIANNGNNGLETVCLQPTACTGPYDYKVSAIGVMVRMYLKGQFNVGMDFGGYNFVDVRDIAHATRMAIDNGRPGEWYILGGYYYTINQFINVLAEIKNRKPPAIIISKGMVENIAVILDQYYKKNKKSKPLLTPYAVRKLDENGNFSIEKARRDLDYNPMKPEDSLFAMVKWIEENEKPKEPTVLHDKMIDFAAKIYNSLRY